MSNNKRIQTVVNNEAFEKLQQIAQQQGLRVADFLREAVKRQCEELGYEIDFNITSWGGKRKGSGRKINDTTEDKQP